MVNEFSEAVEHASDRGTNSKALLRMSHETEEESVE